MWNPFKSKTPPAPTPPTHTVPGQPRRHARTVTDPDGSTWQPAPIAEAIHLTPVVRAWMSESIGHLETGAANREARIEQLRAEIEALSAESAEYRIVAATYRRLIDVSDVTAARMQAAEREPLPAPSVPSQPGEYAATWTIPQPQAQRGWLPDHLAQDGNTETFSAVNGADR